MLRTSGFQARPNSIEARQARCCYTELVFRRELEGNCIDILLLACLHKLYIWHGGGANNHKTKRHHRQCPLLSNVSTCEKKPRIIILEGWAWKPRKASPETACCGPATWICCCVIVDQKKALTSQSWKQIWFKLSSSSKIQFTLNFMCLG